MTAMFTGPVHVADLISVLARFEAGSAMVILCVFFWGGGTGGGRDTKQSVWIEIALCRQVVR